jgi:UrcA family protein
MSRTLLAGAAAVAAAALMQQAPATAQNRVNPEITVEAPVLRGPGQPGDGVHPAMRLATRVAVHTGDLDLRTAYGRAVLDARVRLAADAACDRIDAIAPPVGLGAMMNPDFGDCRHIAMRKAEPAMRRAIQARG